jgi:hypothetical protein
MPLHAIGPLWNTWTAVFLARRIVGRRSTSCSPMPDAEELTFFCAGDLTGLVGTSRHLVVLLDELRAIGVDFVSLGEGIDATTPAGKLQLHILAALAEFERTRIAERVKAGLARVRASGKRLGRPPVRLGASALADTAHLSLRDAAAVLKVSRSVVHRARVSLKPQRLASCFAPENNGRI